MSRRGFFSRIFGGNEDREEAGIYLDEETGMRRFRASRFGEEWRPQGFTVERAAEIIEDLPSDVPRESAVRIVRGTLIAAGLQFQELERSTRTREAKLNSEIDLARNRQDELRKKAEEEVRSLEDEIRKARETRDMGIAEEEENVSRAQEGLERVRRVRDFFGFPETDTKEPADRLGGDSTGDDTQILERFDPESVEEPRHPGPFTDPDGPARGSSTYRFPYDNDER